MKHSVREVELSNGAKGLLIHVPDATVMNFEFSFRAGHAYCDEDKIETAHLMEHMVLGANKKIRSSVKFSAELEANGAYSNAYTSRDNVGYVAECADFEWDRILDLLVLCIGQPIFPKAEYESEFGNVKEELVQRSNNHAVSLFQAIGQDCGATRYSYQKGSKSLKNITLEDVKRYHRRTHYMRNMRFIIAGNVYSRSQSILKKLESIDLPPGDESRMEIASIDVNCSDKPIVVKKRSVPNMYFGLESFSGHSLTEPERDAAWIMNKIMNQGFTSRLMGKARDRGLIYDMNSSCDYGQGFSSWGIEGQVSHDNIMELFELISYETSVVLSRGVTIKELQQAKQKALGEHQRGAQTVGRLADGYSGWYFWDDRIDPFDSYPDRIKAITRQRAEAAFAKLFADNNWTCGILGNSIDEDLAQDLYSKLSSIWR